MTRTEPERAFAANCELSEGRPKAFQTNAPANGGTYRYDALNRLASRTVTRTTAPSSVTTLYVHDINDHIIAETNAAGQTLREYVWLNDMPMAAVDGVNTASPTLYYVHTDHLGRPARMVAQNWAWVWDVIYSPFGGVSAIFDATAKLDMRFPGQWFQMESGLAYNWHRHYDATLGRYVQPDPIGYDGGRSLYGYVGQNPLAYVDFDGLMPRGGERGATGGSSGVNTSNPYKHCREVAGEPNKIECKDHQTGKWVTKPKPADWDQYKGKNKFCPPSVLPWVVFGGVATVCLLQPELCIPAAAVSLPAAGQ